MSGRQQAGINFAEDAAAGDPESVASFVAFINTLVSAVNEGAEYGDA